MNYDIAIISLFFKLRMLDKNIAIDKIHFILKKFFVEVIVKYIT
jgi:hypothetical protein